MITSIQEWFKNHLEIDNSHSEHTIELATAVLLYEVMRADHNLEQLEQDSYRKQLVKHFSLSDSELEDLCRLSQSEADDAADYQQFTRVINDIYDAKEKRTLLPSGEYCKCRFQLILVSPSVA